MLKSSSKMSHFADGKCAVAEKASKAWSSCAALRKYHKKRREKAKIESNLTRFFVDCVGRIMISWPISIAIGTSTDSIERDRYLLPSLPGGWVPWFDRCSIRTSVQKCPERPARASAVLPLGCVARTAAQNSPGLACAVESWQRAVKLRGAFWIYF